MLELIAGRTTVALGAASEAALLAEQLGADDLLALTLPTLARIAAIQGLSQACREHAALAERLATKREDERLRAGARIALGLLALGAGSPAEVIAELEPVSRLAERNAVGEPSVLPFAADLIEAYIRLGDLDSAGTLLEAFASRARTLQRGWALAAAARCAGLMADAQDVEPRFDEAIELGELTSTFERARTALCYGERLRRLNRRKEARAHLRAALESFDEAGAADWAERARAELRATGQTVPRRDPYAPERLTPQELQIALLVADGKSNRDVAGAMFVSRKTVEYHLSHIYRKLNVHSRAELTRLFAASPLSSNAEPTAGRSRNAAASG
jgi:DNA-binding CsgD family transcriptional regulator